MRRWGSVDVIRGFRRRISVDRRLSGIFKGGTSGVISKAATMLVGAVSLPLTVRYLGALEYGLWVTISTTVVMLSVLDMGIANSLTNYISKAYAQQDDALAQRYFATALWLTAGIAALLGLVAMAAWRWVPWAALFHLNDARLTGEASSCCAICFGYFLLGLPLNLAGKVLGGYQEVHLANGFVVVNSLFGLVAIISVILLQGSIVELMFFYCAASLGGTALLNAWLCLWHRPSILPNPLSIRRSMITDLFGEGFLFFVIQIAGLVVFNSDNLVITHYLGAADVTPYSIAWRLAGYASMVQSTLMPSLWPAFAEAYHRQDMRWIRKTYRRVMNGTTLIVLALAMLMGLFGQTLIRWWAGPQAVPDATLLWTMAFWAILVAITANQAMLMAASQRMQLQAVIGILAAVCNLALSIVWVQRMGALGVICATIVSYLVFVVVPQTWQVHQILTGRYLKTVDAI